MPIQFPSNPSLNQEYTYEGKVWRWDGVSWVGVRQETGIAEEKVWSKYLLQNPNRGTRLNSGYSYVTDQRRTRAGTISASKHFMERNLGQFFSGLWTPAQISTALWLDASDFSTITIATGVSQWQDKSGNARNATQATTSLQPEYQATGLNGLPTINWGNVSFSSAGKVLHTPSFSIGTSNIAATFVVARAVEGVNNYVRLVVNNNAGYSNWFLGAGSAANTVVSIAGTSAVGSNIPFSGVSSPFIMAAYANTAGLSANNLRVRLNGGSIISTRTDATGTVGGTGQLAIGAVESGFTPGTYSWRGVISEIIHFNSALTENQVVLIEGYLAWKWGLEASLPAGHLYRNAPPSA